MSQHIACVLFPPIHVIVESSDPLLCLHQLPGLVKGGERGGHTQGRLEWLVPLPLNRLRLTEWSLEDRHVLL